MALNWQVTSGSLPPGMDIIIDSSTRAASLFGRPTKVGTYEFRLTVTDPNGQTVTKQYTVIVDKKLRWSGALSDIRDLPTGEVDIAYNITNRLLIEMLGASTNETFTLSIVSGSLPPGLSFSKVDNPITATPISTTLDSAFVNFSGTPTVSGTYSFTLRAVVGSKSQDISFVIPVRSKYVPPPPPPPPAPTYTLTADRNAVNEGGSVTFTLTTTGIESGTTFPYRITGVSSADIVGGALTGNFTVVTRKETYMLAPGEPEVREITDGTVTISVAADLLTEGTETMVLSLTTVSPTKSVSILVSDTSVTPDPPSYSLTSSAATVTYGQNVTFTLNTQRVSNNTKIYYRITGPTSAMLNNASLTGFFLINNNTAAVTFTTVDFPDYNPATMTMSLFSDSALTVPLNVARSVALQDPPPTYSLNLNKDDATYNETTNREITIELKTTNVQNGTLVPWKIQPQIPISAGLTTDDFEGLASFTGNFTVNNNYARLVLKVKADQTIEGTESFQFQLVGTSPFVTKMIYITNTSGPATSYSQELLKVNPSTGQLEPISSLANYEITEGELFAIKTVITNPGPVILKQTISGTGVTSALFSGAALSYTVFPNQYPGGEFTRQFQTANDGKEGQVLAVFTLTERDSNKVLLETTIPINSPAPPPPQTPIDNGTPNQDINNPGSDLGLTPPNQFSQFGDVGGSLS